MGRNSIKDKASDQNNKNGVGKANKNESTAREKMKDVRNSKRGKKIWSVDALKKTMMPTSEELHYRREKSTGLNPIERYSRLFKCTKCLKNLKFSIEQNKKAPVHPCLGVLMCDQCRDYYEDGEFSLDSDGEDKYCRWCGEGGTIFTCSKCICGFCANCIKHHFSLKFFKDVQKDENWLCFFCNPQPLWFQRYICSLAIQKSEEADPVSPKQTQVSPKQTQVSPKQTQISPKQTQVSPTLSVNEPKNTVLTGNARTRRKRVITYSSSSDETDCEESKSPLKQFKFTSNPLKNLIKDMEKKKSFKNVESGVLLELQKLLKLSEYQMSFGVTWCHDTLKKLANPDHKLTEEGFVDECKKIKWFLSVLSTYLVQFSNSVDSIEKSLCRDDGQKISGIVEKNPSPYTTIFQFLDFLNKQVKTFVQKGISFSDILEATIYDDGKVIGLKKRKNSSKNKNVDSVTSELDLTTDSESNESKEENIEDDTSRGEVSLELDSDQNIESSFLESEGSSPCTTTFRDNNIKVSDSAQEIQKLLSILEHA